MRVDGRRMPDGPEANESAGTPFSDDQLRIVQDWIAAGAPIE
jgi:hypothetical protein